MTRSGVAVAAFALVLASLGFAASGFAQYRPPEPLPEPIPAPDPSPTPAPEGQEPENAPRKPRAVRRLGWRWEPGVVLDGGWF